MEVSEGKMGVGGWPFFLALVSGSLVALTVDTTLLIADSVEDSAEKVEGPGFSVTKVESLGETRDGDVTNDDKTSTLSGLLAGLPALAGTQRLAASLRQKFVTSSGKFFRLNLKKYSLPLTFVHFPPVILNTTVKFRLK